VQNISASQAVLTGTQLSAGIFLLSSGLIYLTGTYAMHCIYKCSESSDGKKILLQVHNIFGKPGRVYEVPIGSTCVLPAQNLDAIAISVEGFSKNFVFSSAEKFNLNPRLRELLEVDRGAFAKEDRSTWRREVTSRKSTKRV
jgi:hypothetical protein